MVHVTHRVSASEPCRGACGGFWALPYLSPRRRPLFLPAACVSVGDGFSQPSLWLALSCLFQDCVPHIGGDGPVCLQWLAGLRVQTSALWSPCRAILKSSTHQESSRRVTWTAETSLRFIFLPLPSPVSSGPCSWGLSHGTCISGVCFLGHPILRLEVTAILAHFGPVENVPYWSYRIPPGSQSWRGTERELHPAVDSQSSASCCFLLTRFSLYRRVLPSFVLDSDANAPVVGVVGRCWLGAGAANELSTTRPHHTQRWVSSLTGSSWVSRLFHGDSPSKMPTHFLAPVGIRSLARIKIGDREIKWTLQHSK